MQHRTQRVQLIREQSRLAQRRALLANDFPFVEKPMTASTCQMSDEFLDQIASAAIADHKAKAVGVQATPFLDRLGAVLKWLRDHNVTFLAIMAKLPAIIAALSAGDWLTVIAQLIALFGLPANTPGPAGLS